MESMSMKRYYIITAVICLAAFLGVGLGYKEGGMPEEEVLKVGFIYENDESTPYSYNFSLAQSVLEKEFGERVQVLAYRNVPAQETEGPLKELVKRGCGIIFINNYSEQVRVLAAEYPEVQFCQVSFSGSSEEEPATANYHTFNGKIYQGQYVSGMVAGMKLKALLESGAISPAEAQVGMVSAYPEPESISGFTAFLLGVRSEAPEAVMRVRYTHSWSSYSAEKACARALIDEGCIVIAQMTHTIGPAVACEKAETGRPVIHVGFNQNMIDVAPATSLISTRVNWAPYVVGAVEAVLAGKAIEKTLEGDIHGQDISAGFERDWVEMLELNRRLAAEGTEQQMKRLIQDFRRGKDEVFKGPYIGVNPDNPADTYDLRWGYTENQSSSVPSFAYILQDVIQVEE